MREGESYFRVVYKGQAVLGPCLVTGLIFEPAGTNDYATVYDGDSATGSKTFAVLRAAVRTTHNLNFGAGVPFANGVHIVGANSATAVTVRYIQPVPEP